MSKLDDVKLISKLDKASMLKLISELPEQCQKAYAVGKNFDVPKIEREINGIVFVGLGGSAIGADIVRIYLQNELKIPVIVSRNYKLPSFVGKNTLLFCLSYSGNTEETLSSFEDGVKKGAYIITMGSGGKLEQLSIKNNFKHIKIPTGFPPRAAVGYTSITLLPILTKLGLIEDKEKEVSEVYSVLKELKDKELGVEVPLKNNISKKLAEKLYGNFSIIYGTSDSTEAASIRLRGQIAENSKALSSSHVFPEMNHNEIVGWEFPKEVLKKLKVIILSDENDHPRTKKRIKISKKIIKESGAEVFELKKESSSFLARLFSLIYIGDFLSFYLAILNGIDPMPVKRVEYLKSELAKGE